MSSPAQVQQDKGPIKVGEISVEVVEARNLPSKVYYCTVRIRNQSQSTNQAAKSSNPVWGQTFTFPVTEIDNELRLTLHSKQKVHSCGEVSISLAMFKSLDTPETKKWHKIIKTMSDINVSGEVFLCLKYKPLGDSSVATNQAMKAIQANLLQSLQSGPTTAFEQMENAVLEEHGFFTAQLKRQEKQAEGKETSVDGSNTKTVQSMLEILEKTADQLKLKRWMDIKVEDVRFCLDQIQRFSKTDVREPVKTLDEIEDDLVVVSSELTSIIQSLSSKQLSLQRDALALLEDRLNNDSEKRSFVHGGGISALLQLLTSQNEQIVLKSLELLQNATFYESSRPHRELDPLSIVETLSGYTASRNKDMRMLSACVITNLLCLKHDALFKHFTSDVGKHDIKNLLSSPDEFLTNRTLWAISVMPAGDKTSLLNLIWTELLAAFSSKSSKIQAKAAAVIANFAYDDENMSYFSERHEELVPLLVQLLQYRDQRTYQSLRAVTNLFASKEFRNAFSSVQQVELISACIPVPELQTQACWALGNLALEDRTVLAVRNSGAIETLLGLLSTEGVSLDTLEKIVWVLNNTLIDEKSKEIMISKKGGLQAFIQLLKPENERIISIVLDLICSLAAENVFVSASFGELKGMKTLVELLPKCNQPSSKESICWAIARLSVGNALNQDAVREAGGLTDLGELIESSATQYAVTWAIFNLIVDNKENLAAFKKLGVIPSLVICLQDETSKEIAARTLALLAEDAEQKQKIIETVVREVKTRKVSLKN